MHEERPARMIVDLEGEVIWMSAAAQALMDARSPFLIRGGRLTSLQPAVAKRLLDCLDAVDDKPRCTLIGEAATWVIWARRIRVGDTDTAGLIFRRRGEGLEFAALAEACRLTPAEGRVLEMMLAGADTGRIALSLAISVETLRTHVKHAYRKLGVSSRGQLFAGALDFIRP